MAELYRQPISQARFNRYLALLQGNSGSDMELPIGGYNPMAKAPVLEAVEALLAMDAEAKMQALLDDINRKAGNSSGPEILVALNVTDDVGGAWSERYSTGYNLLFDLGPLVKRHCCTPTLWMSETPSLELLKTRTLAAAYRTVHWLEHGQPRTLKACVAQEVFVQRQLPDVGATASASELEPLRELLAQEGDSELYNVIFNFFFGDAVSESLGYPSHGVGKLTGFDLVRYLAQDNAAN